MTDRLEDVAEPAAVPDERFVRVRVRVRVRAAVIGMVQRPANGHGQPPAIAGRRRTSSAAATGVSRPAR